MLCGHYSTASPCHAAIVAWRLRVSTELSTSEDSMARIRLSHRGIKERLQDLLVAKGREGSDRRVEGYQPPEALCVAGRGRVFLGLRLRSHGKPRALRCRDVPTAVGVVYPPRKRGPRAVGGPVVREFTDSEATVM